MIPPLEDNLLTGDILFVHGGDRNTPESFRLLLSPSCDLVVRSNGKSKIDWALVAKCEPLQKYVNSVKATAKIHSGDLAKRLPGFLSQPHVGGCVPLPALIEDIGPREENDQKYLRLASIDSPFREYIVWAFLTVTGRPGIPERDLNEWAQEIISDLDRDRDTGADESC